MHFNVRRRLFDVGRFDDQCALDIATTVVIILSQRSLRL